jgi:hypothetical protein
MGPGRSRRPTAGISPRGRSPRQRRAGGRICGGAPGSVSGQIATHCVRRHNQALQAHSGEKVANRNVWGFGWAIAHAAVSRRPPNSLDTMVARTHMYTYDAQVLDLPIVQGPFSVAPCQNPKHTIRNFFHRCTVAPSLARERRHLPHPATRESGLGLGLGLGATAAEFCRVLQWRRTRMSARSSASRRRTHRSEW